MDITDHWKDWLGSIRTRALPEADLVLLATGPTDHPEVLDGDNQELLRRARPMRCCLRSRAPRRAHAGGPGRRPRWSASPPWRVWARDRLHRSMVGAIQTALELDRLGVRVVSVRETWLDTDSSVRPLLVAIFGWVAEQERTRLIERTKAGMSRARKEGKKIGRTRTSTVLLHAAADLVAAGVPLAEAARRKGVSRARLRRWMAERAGEGGPGKASP